MSTFISASIIALSAGRIGLGLAPFVAASASARLIGFPTEHDNPTARLMGRMFGVRDIGLGVLGLYALFNPQVRPFVFWLNAAMDAGDLVAIGMALLGRAGIDRGAWRSAAAATTGGLGWILLGLLA